MVTFSVYHFSLLNDLKGNVNGFIQAILSSSVISDAVLTVFVEFEAGFFPWNTELYISGGVKGMLWLQYTSSLLFKFFPVFPGKFHTLSKHGYFQERRCCKFLVYMELIFCQTVVLNQQKSINLSPSCGLHMFTMSDDEKWPTAV